MWLKHDLPAGIAVSFVALPLCLGIAMASGAPLYSGLLSGIVGGIVIALLSGSQLSVSGPAAGLSTLVAATILSQGSFSAFLPIVITAGIFQIALGLLKMGTLSYYFPSAVIKGMLAAIGIILITKQLPIALGYNSADFWSTVFPNIFTDFHPIDHFQKVGKRMAMFALIITAVSLTIMAILRGKNAGIMRYFPAPVAVVAVGILINEGFSYWLSGTHWRKNLLVDIPPFQVQNFVFPQWEMLGNFETWKSGLLLGLLASLETLLCVEAIDKMDPRHRITPVNRELWAQGIGNVLCGIIGALPVTAVVVRGAANVQAGARTRLSAFTHGLLLLVAVVSFPFLLNRIPYPALAALLIFTGFQLTKPQLYLSVYKQGLKQFLPFMLTIAVILFTDLLLGVGIGLLLSAYFIIQNNFKAEYHIQKRVEAGREIFVIVLNSNVTFLNKVKLSSALESIPDNSQLTIDGSNCNFIDYDILDMISRYVSKAAFKRISVKLIHIETVAISDLH